VSAIGRVGICEKLGAGKLLILGVLGTCPPPPEKFKIYNIEIRKCHFLHSELDADLLMA